MTTTTPMADAPSLSFADARACKAWLAGLAVTHVAQALATLADALRAFNRSEFEPLERLKCLELMRDRIAFVFGEERSRHRAKPLPLSAQDATAWTNARQVIEEMEAGYRRCLEEPALAAHTALIAQRIVRHIGAQMLLHSLVYRPFDAALWSRLHQQYLAAERAGQATERVKDSLEGEGGVSSVAEAYARVVLLQAAGIHEMSGMQVAFAEALLQLWIRKVQVLAKAPGASAVCPLVVDVDGAQGAQAAPCDSVGASQRVIDTEGLVRSIRRRIRALQNGEDLAALGLPVEASGVDPLQALTRLAKRWGEPAPREAPRQAHREATAALAFGLADIHFFLAGGKPFEQPGQERELSHQEKEDIAVFGRVTQRTQSMMAPAQSLSLEPWDVIDESVDNLRLRRRAGATKGVAVGRLVGLRFGTGRGMQVGSVRALLDEPQGFMMTVALFPGTPEPTAVRGAKPPWSQGLALPAVEGLGVPATVIAPSATAFRGRPIHLWKDGAVEARVQDLLERGADFDRVAVS